MDSIVQNVKHATFQVDFVVLFLAYEARVWNHRMIFIMLKEFDYVSIK